MKCIPKEFGALSDGTPVKEFTLSNDKVTAKILTYGGIIRELWVPDRTGAVADIVLGYDTLDEYVQRNRFFGTLTGRVANRIAKGSFTLDGEHYSLAINNGPNHLHGGIKGFDKVVWRLVESFSDTEQASVILQYVSADREEGYPGELTTTVRYTLNRENELSITYEATTTKATPVNLTSHSYFNLSSTPGTPVLNHQLQLHARAYTPVDETLIPTGEIASVEGTPFNFLTSKTIGKDIGAVSGGYDHNFVINHKSGGGTQTKPTLAAIAYEPESGRVMEISTTEPGVQLYTGNFLDGSLVGKGSIPYQKHAGFCLETQHFPDAVHHEHFPSIILHPGEKFFSETVHRFSVK